MSTAAKTSDDAASRAGVSKATTAARNSDATDAERIAELERWVDKLTWRERNDPDGMAVLQPLEDIQAQQQAARARRCEMAREAGEREQAQANRDARHTKRVLAEIEAIGGSIAREEAAHAQRLAELVEKRTQLQCARSQIELRARAAGRQHDLPPLPDSRMLTDAERTAVSMALSGNAWEA